MILPLALPNTLWFGIFRSCTKSYSKIYSTSYIYYLAIESLNKAPSSFIQYKAIEILLHLKDINNESFSMIKLDFNQYTQKLYENDSSIFSSEKFQSLLIFVKEKC